ncbi:MAG TPA: hypothetical protein VKX17_27225 [Planctomycetota bacterium]|nr:hypothetical protein [Planctomycetota bacterium]
MDNLQNRAAGVMDNIQQGVRSIGESGKNAVNAAIDKGAEWKRSVVKSGQEALEKSDKYVKENPRFSVSMAFVSGMVIGGLTMLVLDRCLLSAND